MSIPPTKPTSMLLRALLTACAVAYTPCNVASAENLSLPVWEQSGGGRGPDGSLFPSRGEILNGNRGDIFQGGATRPEIVVPSSMFDSMPSAPSVPAPVRSGAAANVGSAVRNIQTGNPLGAFRAVGAAASQGPAAIPAVGQVVGGVGGSLPGGAGQIARTVQAGAQVVGGAAAIGSALGQFQRGGSGAQGAIGAIGNAAGVGQGLGSVGQGQPANLQGILQGLGGGAASSAFGNGIGAGPFGQFVGSNNQIVQGMQFISLLQQIFAAFMPVDSAFQFNQSNTGQSARTAFVNLMGANSGAADPGQGESPVSPITAVPCSNGQKDRTKPYNELNASPATRVKLTKLCVKEVGGQGEDAQVALFETLFNRSSAEGNSIDRAMHNGYYEPINKGTVDSVSTSSSAYASCDRALNRALAGSSTIGCRRHAATNCDWARRFGGDPSSCVTIGGEAFYSKPGDSCDENFC